MANVSWLRNRANRPFVASLLALPVEVERSRSQFEVMVGHLYHRMLNNEVFGEEAAARIAELSYAIALPGVLVALFLFPAYHGLPPHPLERSFISQACDHLFYVTYAFVVMGCAVIFQWEMLFPDALDVSVMTTLPISMRRLLMGRITAVVIFLALVQAGTSGLGCLFLPAVADQRCGFFRQLLAQVTAVSMSGVCIVAALVTLQAVLLWMPGGRLAEMIRSATKVSVLAILMTILFLFPLTAHFLGGLLGEDPGAGIVRWIPTFWFLGIYDSIMWGDHAPRIFHTLAMSGYLFTTGLLLLAAFAYPLGYTRRVKLLVEGSPLTGHHQGSTRLRSALHRFIFKTPRTRSTAYLAVQTLLRIERLHLYLAMYVGIGTALVLSSVLALRIDGSRIRLVLQADGLLMTIPLVAFWSVAGLMTALHSPVGKRGSWLFQAISGSPGREELSGGRRVTMCVSLVVTVGTMVLLKGYIPQGITWARDVASLFLFGCGLPLVLTELFFANVRTVPFTGATIHSLYTLPFAFVRYFVLLPAFVLSMKAAEIWAAESMSKMFRAAILLGGGYVCSRYFRVWLSSRPSTTHELTLVALHEE